MNLEALEKIGLNKSEIEVYLTLIRKGSLSVNQIAEESGVHRTNIYSIANKLESMGLVSYFSEGGRRKYSASDPENLLNYLKNSQSLVENLVPDLNKIRKTNKDEISVEIYKGEGGVRSAFNDIIREGKDFLGFGLAGQMRKNVSIYTKQWLRDLRKNKIKSKHLYVEGIIKPADFGEFEVRYLPKEFYSPVVNMIYADKVSISLWEPSFVIILIKSKQVANEYRKYFNLLWGIAKE